MTTRKEVELKDSELKKVFLKWLARREDELYRAGSKRTRMAAMRELIEASTDGDGVPRVSYPTLTNWLGGFHLGHLCHGGVVAALTKLGMMGGDANA